ncbi:MAG: hypothetical protein LBU35_00390 [Holosporales bacterium]|jgi:NADH-quinone oxidoreductase subunit M|nr:hypothetical protein [Holosporales bacterium]
MLGLQAFFTINAFPILGGLFIMGINEKNPKNIKLVSLWTTLFSVISSFTLLILYLIQGKSEILKKVHIIKIFNAKYTLLFDNFSIIFILLISFICFLIVLWLQEKQNIRRIKKFFVSLLIFQSLAISSVLTSDIFLLFIFMESSIIPLYFMLNSFKKSGNFESILNLIIYSLLSALLILIALIMIYYETKTSNLIEIYNIGVKNSLIFWILFIGIAIKIPVWPFYYWLPIVHVKSSTGCSVVLASIVLKYSSLLILRLILPVFGDFLFAYSNILLTFFVLSAFFAISQAIFQNDLKKIFAYFSIIHMNMMCIMLLGNISQINFIFGILSHSLVIALLFFVTDAMKSVFKSRYIMDLKNSGVCSNEIKKIFFISILALIGAPGSCGFVLETLCVYSIAKVSIVYLFILCAIILFSAIFLFRLYCSIFPSQGINNAVEDFKFSEICKKSVLYLILFSITFLGVFPKFILDYFPK